jgi:hypothetical protein
MRKSNPFVFALAFLVSIGVACPAGWGWISTGHKVVAMIAWDDLTPKTRAAVTALLKLHPRYEKDLLQDASADETPDEQARIAFATAATWPDLVRMESNPMHYAYNHPAWHYIDIPYIVGGVTPPTEPGTNTAGPHNAVEALTQCVAELRDPKTTDANKAIDLCWIEHLVGDIHQPLHAASMYSPKLPRGDQGGNLEQVLRDPPYPDSRANLHLIWDSLPGDFYSDELCGFEARGLRSGPRYSREKMKDLLAVTDFMDWAKESHALAVQDAYLDGKIEFAIAPPRGAESPTTNPTEMRRRRRRPTTGPAGELGAPTTGPSAERAQAFSSSRPAFREPTTRDANGQQIPGLPPGYLRAAEHVAMQRVSLAGYRLADQLNAIFDKDR